MSQFLDMYDDYLTEDYETLFSEETLLFMEKASEPVKKSFFQKMITGLKSLFEKVSEMSRKLVEKLSIGKVKKAVDANPELKKKKLKTKDYEKSLKLGKDTSEKIKKAKSAKEVKKITDEYKAKRKKILAATIGVTVGALVVGGAAFGAHKYLKDVKGGINDIEVLSGDVVDADGRVLNKGPIGLPGKKPRKTTEYNYGTIHQGNKGMDAPRLGDTSTSTLNKRQRIGSRTSKEYNYGTVHQGGSSVPRLPEKSSATREKEFNKALKDAAFAKKDVELKSAQCTALAVINNDMLGDIKASNEFIGGKLGQFIQAAKKAGLTFGNSGSNSFVMRN